MRYRIGTLQQAQAGGEPVNPDLRNLVALQDLEQKIASLQKQISEVPAQMQLLQNELQHIRQTHHNKTIQIQELTKRRRTHEGEVDMMRTKLARLKDQLMSVKTNKEYTAMLHEIQAAEDRIRVEEDRILEIMEESENAERDLKAAEAELKSRTASIQENVQKLEASVPTLDAEVAALLQQRSNMEIGVESDLLERYRRIAQGRKGMAMAEAKDELCTACHVRIRPQVYADLMQTENIHQCDSCSRILFLREAP